MIASGAEFQVLDLRLNQKIDGAAGAVPLTHWWRGLGDTMEVCTACQNRSAVHLVDEFRLLRTLA
jgi:hypothetical protein